MRKIILFLTGSMLAAGVAVAEPNRAPRGGDPIDQQDVQVTVRAGQGRLGLQALQISGDLRVHFGAPADRGVLVDGIRAGSPAEKAGVHVGDVVVEVDGEATRSASDMLRAMADRKKGDRVGIVAYRSGQKVTLTATLESDPAPLQLGGFAPALDPDAFFRDFQRSFGRGLRDLPAPGRERKLEQRLRELEQRLEKLERPRT